jgi:hypothetical protein
LARVFLAGALCLPAAAVLVPSDASASVSIAVAFDMLVKDADVVAVATPSDTKSIWEDGRIYTYTKIKVDQGVAGDAGAGAEGWVRTMGGVVDKIGQLVDGEPVFVPGKQSLLFLRKFKAGEVYEVAARAQGQYPITLDERNKIKKLIRSSNVGVLLPPKDKGPIVSSQTQPQSTNGSGVTEVTPQMRRLALDVLHDKPLDDVAREIATTWKRLHPTPPAK